MLFANQVLIENNTDTSKHKKNAHVDAYIAGEPHSGRVSSSVLC